MPGMLNPQVQRRTTTGPQVDSKLCLPVITSNYGLSARLDDSRGGGGGDKRDVNAELKKELHKTST